MAGAETSSTTLKWFFLYMVEFPDVQERIQEEIDAVVGRDRLPNWNDKAR
jgi:cytochrome P450